jgi:cysteine-rich secretory family protein
MYRSFSLTTLVCVLAIAATRAPLTAQSARWLDRVNFYRATALLPPVAEDPALSRAVLQHARYMVMHGLVEHSERPRDRWTTADGAAAAAVSNLAGSTSATEPESWAVDLWMQAPFHAIGILDPALEHVGFGIEHAHKGLVQTAAGLDVIRGRRLPPSTVTYPIVWPADGAVVPIAAHVNEYPSPLTSCPGYVAPAGLPLIVQLESADAIAGVTASWIMDGDRPLDHCDFDGASYRNPDPVQQLLGRRILTGRNALILIAREPLRPGAAYRARGRDENPQN